MSRLYLFSWIFSYLLSAVVAKTALLVNQPNQNATGILIKEIPSKQELSNASLISQVVNATEKRSLSTQGSSIGLGMGSTLDEVLGVVGSKGVSVQILPPQGVKLTSECNSDSHTLSSSNNFNKRGNRPYEVYPPHTSNAIAAVDSDKYNKDNTIACEVMGSGTTKTVCRIVGTNVVLSYWRNPRQNPKDMDEFGRSKEEAEDMKREFNSLEKLHKEGILIPQFTRNVVKLNILTSMKEFAFDTFGTVQQRINGRDPIKICDRGISVNQENRLDKFEDREYIKLQLLNLYYKYQLKVYVDDFQILVEEKTGLIYVFDPKSVHPRTLNKDETINLDRPETNPARPDDNTSAENCENLLDFKYFKDNKEQLQIFAGMTKKEAFDRYKTLQKKLKEHEKNKRGDMLKTDLHKQPQKQLQNTLH